jgi:hypothetical protein
MKALALAMVMLVAVTSFGQEKKAEAKKPEAKGLALHGYVVDHMCAKTMAKKGDPMTRAAKHTKECALEEACAASGYGMFYDNGKWIKFDENGDKLAKVMFEKSEKTSDFMADVKGEMSGDVLKVRTLAESKMSGDDMKKPAKDEMHDHKH